MTTARQTLLPPRAQCTALRRHLLTERSAQRMCPANTASEPVSAYVATRPEPPAGSASGAVGAALADVDLQAFLLAWLPAQPSAAAVPLPAAALALAELLTFAHARGALPAATLVHQLGRVGSALDAAQLYALDGAERDTHEAPPTPTRWLTP